MDQVRNSSEKISLYDMHDTQHNMLKEKLYFEMIILNSEILNFLLIYFLHDVFIQI